MPDVSFESLLIVITVTAIRSAPAVGLMSAVTAALVRAGLWSVAICPTIALVPHRRPAAVAGGASR